MNTSYIRQDNNLAIAHFKALGCVLTAGTHKGVFRCYDYDSDNFIRMTTTTDCYYVYGNGFDTMTKSAFRRYLKRYGLRVEDQVRAGLW